MTREFKYLQPSRECLSCVRGTQLCPLTQVASQGCESQPPARRWSPATAHGPLSTGPAFASHQATSSCEITSCCAAEVALKSASSWPCSSYTAQHFAAFEAARCRMPPTSMKECAWLWPVRASCASSSALLSCARSSSIRSSRSFCTRTHTRTPSLRSHHRNASLTSHQKRILLVELKLQLVLRLRLILHTRTFAKVRPVLGRRALSCNTPPQRWRDAPAHCPRSPTAAAP